MDVAVAATNKTPVSSIRGAGYPQAAFAMERMMDRVARELKIDRAELRRRNLIPAEKMPYTKPLKARSGAPMQYDSGDYPACQAMVLKAAGWDDFPERQAGARAQGRYIGIGLAHGIKGTGRGPFESGLVRVSNTGRVTVYHRRRRDRTGLADRAGADRRERARLRADEITVVPGDTSGVALGLGAFASRQTVTAGNSVLLAARAVADKAKKLASHILEAAEHDLELVDGEVRVVGAPQLSVKLAELSRILKGAPGYGFPPGVDPGLDANVNWRTDALAYANACHVAEVEVDIETGDVRILRYFALQDSGVLINPMMVDGQLHGGIAHGIGNALFEWMGYDDAAQPVTTTFADYLLPTATELPIDDHDVQGDPLPAQPARLQGRRRGLDDPDRGGRDLRRRGRALAVRRAHRAGPDHAERTGRADRRPQQPSRRLGDPALTMADLVSRTELIVEWGYCDPAGIVFNARFFDYFDIGTWLLFEVALGVKRSEIATAFGIIGYPVVDAKARFIAPVKFGDRIEIASTVKEFRRSSFDVEHRITNQGTLAVEGFETRVWTGRNSDDPTRLRSQPIPPDVKERFRTVK